MDKNEAAKWLNHRPHVLARGVIRRNRRADCDPAVFCNLGCDVAYAANIDVAVFLRKTQLRREMLPHEIAVEQSHRPATHLEKLDHQHIRDRRFARAGEAGKKYSHPLFVPRRKCAPEFARDFWKSEPGRNLAAVV